MAWTTAAGGTTNLFDSINESSADDADYIISGINPTDDIVGFTLSNPTAGLEEPVTLRFRFRKDNAATDANLTVRLLQGEAEIASWEYLDIAATFVTEEETLTTPQFEAITDPDDLRIEFEASLAEEVVPFALDGSGHANSSGATTVVSLTTTNGQGVIVVATTTNAASFTSVTASGLTFTQKSSVTNTNSNHIAIWTAPYTTNFSGNITVTPASANFTTVDAFGISGTDVVPEYDSGGPQTSTTTTQPITTANANDFIFAVNNTTADASTASGSGWTQLSGVNYLNVTYRIETTTQAAIAPTFTVSGSNGGISHAVEKAV